MTTIKTVYGSIYACTTFGTGSLVRPIGKSVILLQNKQNLSRCYLSYPLADKYPGIPQEISEYQNPTWITLKYYGDPETPQEVWGNYSCQYWGADSLFLSSTFSLRVFHPQFTMSSADVVWYGISTNLKISHYIYEIIPSSPSPNYKTFFAQRDRHVYGLICKPWLSFWAHVCPSGYPVEIYHLPVNVPNQIYIGTTVTNQYGYFDLNIDFANYSRTIQYGDIVRAFCFEKAGYPQTKTPYAGGEQVYFPLLDVPEIQDRMYPIIGKLTFTENGNGLFI